MDSLISGLSQEKRIVPDYDKLSTIVEGLKGVGGLIVVTIGTFDMIHIGHSRYLAKAAERGDILIVGVDTDEVVLSYKNRPPVIPLAERMEMLTHLRYVDFVTEVSDVDQGGNWQYGLIRALKPDIFQAVEDSYPENQIAEIQQHCKEVVVIPRQAENSSSALLRKEMQRRLRELAELV